MNSLTDSLDDVALIIADVSVDKTHDLDIPEQVQRRIYAQRGNSVWHWFWTPHIPQAAELLQNFQESAHISRLCGHFGAVLATATNRERQLGGPAVHLLEDFIRVQPTSSSFITEPLKARFEETTVFGEQSKFTPVYPPTESLRDRQNWFLLDEKAKSKAIDIGQFHGFPSPETRFVGRGDWLKRIHEALKENRWVSLKGMAGVGKTRLAVRAARRWAIESREHSAFFVDLSSVKPERRAVGEAIAKSLDIETQGNAQQLLSSLVHKLEEFTPALLVCDNAEHVRAEVRNYTASILQVTQETNALITTRSYLETDRPLQFKIPPLPEKQALLLLESRFREEKAFDRLEPASFEDASFLLDYTNRIPLALEIIAAQANQYSLRELVEKLNDNESADSIDGGLEEVIEWSWTLLRESEQRLLKQASVFEAPFTREQLRSVVSTQGTRWSFAELLESLLNHSLIRRSSRSEGKLHLPNPIRRFAASRRSQELTTNTQQRFCAYFTDRVEKLAEEYRAGQQYETLEQMEADIAHYRHAVRLKLEQEPERAGELFLNLMPYFFCRGRIPQWDRMMSDIIDALQNEELGQRRPRLEAKLRIWRAKAYLKVLTDFPLIEEELDKIKQLGNTHELGTETKAVYHQIASSLEQSRAPEASVEHAEEGLEIIGDAAPGIKGDLLGSLGAAYRRVQGSSETPIEYQRKALNLARRNGLDLQKAEYNQTLGLELHWAGDFHSALERYESALELVRKLGIARTEIRLLMRHSDAKMSTGSLEGVEPKLSRALYLARSGGLQYMLPNIHVKFGRLYNDQLDFPRADDHLTEALDTMGNLEEHESPYYVAVTYASRGFTKGALGQFALADNDFREAEKLKNESVKKDFLEITISIFRYGAKIREAVESDEPTERLRRLENELEQTYDQIDNPWGEVIKSDFYRTVQNYLTASLQEQGDRREAPRNALVIDEDFDWFEPPGTTEREDISNAQNYETLLSELVTNAPEPVSSDTLIDALWPDSDPSSRKNRFYTTMHRFRSKGLEDTIENTDEGYRVSPDVEIVKI